MFRTGGHASRRPASRRRFRYSARSMVRQLGPYVIERQIGRGGMGVIYLGRDTRLDRPIAIKVLPDLFASDPERLSRFDREARLLASLNHPHIGAIYGIEQSGE